jgi:peptidyl-prolyl cis-trans isomerase A (cyclophilin A)
MKKLLALLAVLAVSLPAWAANPMVEMKTNYGAITIELYPDKAPKTVANFLQYTKDGFYNGTIFHRVIDGFMIQGGGMEQGMKEKPTRATIENEARNGLRNLTGTLAMARKPDPHSASAQFFINLKDNAFLDYPGHDGWGYCVFGKVVQGIDTVRKIARVGTGRSGFHQDVPNSPVVIESVKLIETK